MPERATFEPSELPQSLSFPEAEDYFGRQEEEADEVSKKREQGLYRRLATSFFLFGLINNVLYVIILSAALDLVPPSTPKGIILFCNIAPSLVAKVCWPYLLRGRIRYVRRLLGCCLLSTSGMLVVALFNNLPMRLLGISFASFSSGLGELTFLQLSTTYAPPSIAGYAVSYFASGTGAAGLVGAFLWWELRGLGVRLGVGLSCVMPSIIPITYFLLLPHAGSFLNSMAPSTYEDILSPVPDLSTLPYTPLATAEDEDGEEEGSLPAGPKRGISLSLNDKWKLVKPLLAKYMLPLFCVYLFEYTINQGIGPTLLYPVPSSTDHWILSKIIHGVRDYYPLWQLVYQSTVFLSRSSISFGLPALPERLLALPAVLQGMILILLSYESAVGVFGPGDGKNKVEKDTMSIVFVFMLIALEGICGGLAYVNVFYRITHEAPNQHVTVSHTSSMNTNDIEWTRQEREFKIGSIGFADSTGILLASLLSMPTEVELCKAQVARGKMLCKGL
ncbi:batten's disease protein Cln3 [Crepidotus variabilis]|uniref:Protein BTN n=1 Tax=Crepidotus variabilis TaxID=179855 RepID=A0A9P6JLX2_9AGAR|nr:batten's disease protein Cln3 [Crepidotus variabilis]